MSRKASVCRGIESRVMIGEDVARGDGAVANATAGALESVCSVAQLAARNATTSNTEARETRGNNRRISPFPAAVIRLRMR